MASSQSANGVPKRHIRPNSNRHAYLRPYARSPAAVSRLRRFGGTKRIAVPLSVRAGELVAQRDGRPSFARLYRHHARTPRRDFFDHPKTTNSPHLRGRTASTEDHTGPSKF